MTTKEKTEDTRLAWLRAQLADDAAVAANCRHQVWTAIGNVLAGDAGPAEPSGRHWSHLARATATHDPQGAAIVHAARHDPRRVRRLTGALLSILDDYETMLSANVTDEGREWHEAVTCTLRDVVNTLAKAYADTSPASGE